LDRRILAISELEYDGIYDNLCSTANDEDLIDAEVVPIIFRQNELDSISLNALTGGVIGAEGFESLQELQIVMWSLIIGPPAPTPTVNALVQVLSDGNIPAIIEFQPCMFANPSFMVPELSFEFNACEFQFENYSESDFVYESIQWDFDNGNTSNEFDPDIVFYNNEGDFDVSLTLCNGMGCDTLVQTISIAPLDVSIPESATVGVPVQFYSNSPTHTNQSWVFGDGNISLEESPMHTYDLPGLYSLELILTDSTSVDCTTNIFETISVELPSGFEVQEKMTFHIYPNPSSEYAMIRVGEEHSSGQLVVWNESGQEVFRDSNASTSEYHLNVSSYQQGIYLVQITTLDSQKWSEKLIVH